MRRVKSEAGVRIPINSEFRTGNCNYFVLIGLIT